MSSDHRTPHIGTLNSVAMKGFALIAGLCAIASIGCGGGSTSENGGGSGGGAVRAP
jgi:hypothetical protein